MSAVVNVTAKARRETCMQMSGDTRGRNVDPLEVHLEVRSQSNDYAADSSGVGNGNGVMSDQNARIDGPTVVHGKPARDIPAVVGADGQQHLHACYRVHTRQKRA